MSIFSYKDIYNKDRKKVLEVNILPVKQCNFDCIFCPIGRAKEKVDVQKSFEETECSIIELKQIIENETPELVFINSKGEAFINDKIEDIVDMIKEKGIPVRLLSNGYLLGENKYSGIANKCDEVIGELKATTEESFQKLQRPMKGYTLENYISNMIAFNQQYKGKFIFEVTVINGVNDDKESIKIIKEVITKIAPDKIMIERIEDEPFKKKLGMEDEKFEQIKKEILS